MPFPMLENASGSFCIYNGEKITYDSAIGTSLSNPIPDIIYYESIRIREGILIFFENHMTRLMRSIEAKENFTLDTELLYTYAMRLINESEPRVTDGNIRIVITRNAILVHFSDAIYPSAELFQEGIICASLLWERREPQVKVFREDYKMAVYNKMHAPTAFGLPYEVLLYDNEGQLTEGSRSNFLVLLDGTVYSPPEETILIGITRKYVMQAIRASSLRYEERTFSLEELVRLRDQATSVSDGPALFVTSSPFDILPVRSVDDQLFSSASHEALRLLSESYRSIVDAYVLSRRTDAL